MTQSAKYESESPTATTQVILEADGVTACYDRQPVLHNVSLGLHPGELVGILGPNGCGKSTLFKVLTGHLSPTQGRVLLQGNPLGSVPNRQRARQLAMLPQHASAPAGMTVWELIRYGRAPYARWYQPFTQTDQDVMDHVMGLCAMRELAHRPLTELSGGERQRAWIAMTLAQQPRVLLLDEPTSALDIGHQLDVMQLLVDLVEHSGLAVAVVMHDINLAVRFCTRIVVMRAGRICGECLPGGNQDWSLIEEVFGVDACPTSDGPARGLGQLCFVRRR